MDKMKCPKCKKNIEMSAEICPHCNEMIFHDVIVSDNVVESEETKANKIGKAVKKGFINKIAKSKFFSKIKKVNIFKKNKIVKKIKKNIRLFRKKMDCVWDKVRKSKIYPYITYQNVLCVITVFATIAMVVMGIKIAKFTDNTSTLSKVDSKTTYMEVEKMEDEKVEKRLDLQRGLIIMIYKDQKYAGIKTTVTYEVVPKTKKINQTIITFPYDKSDVQSMKQYLEVNYGYAKKLEDGTLEYVDDKYRYTFTNGTTKNEDSIWKDERVEIIPLIQE